ncbi:hypothetical protein TeGR_g9343 [Tetraparma gracilis]|uniref:Uncharacterized protein n=1 Tax=Tetraparma gracilis TaxID=2962635 RepID=A0ABQ6MQ58_9STRA|nr:hypothetical protein TeGR_g9343 [Tetraparma gracilis]
MHPFPPPCARLLSALPTDVLSYLCGFLALPCLLSLFSCDALTHSLLHLPLHPLPDRIFRPHLPEPTAAAAPLRELAEELRPTLSPLLLLRLLSYAPLLGLYSLPSAGGLQGGGLQGGVRGALCRFGLRAAPPRLALDVAEPEVAGRTGLMNAAGATGFRLARTLLTVSLDPADFLETRYPPAPVAHGDASPSSLRAALPPTEEERRQYRCRLLPPQPPRLPVLAVSCPGAPPPPTWDAHDGFPVRSPPRSRPPPLALRLLPLPAPASPGGHLGLYAGCYGPHGDELVHVAAGAGGGLLGRKVTGDPNVPAGKLTFRTVGKLEGGGGWGGGCGCEFACECPGGAEREGLEVEGGYRAECKTARVEYRDAEWSAGRLLVVREGEGSAWEGRGRGLGGRLLERDWGRDVLFLKFEGAIRTSIKLRPCKFV